jgi:glycosyltransferase involved in cell wall biosynthesis
MFESNPRISVIMPVYKAERYLHKSIDCILNQTFQDLELLLVDDGSPDASGRICDEYAAKDARVRVFHKENGGVSSARQCGLDNARGEYLIHADPDDWTEPDMLEELYAKAKEDDADMVICDFYWDRGYTISISRQKPEALDHEAVLSGLFRQLHGSCCNKLVRTEVFRKYDIGFNDGLSFCEDLMINARLLKNPLNIAYLDKPFYHYVQHVNQNSISRSYSLDVYEYDMALSEKLMQVTKDTRAEMDALVHMRTMTLQRAFFSGFFTSAEFRRRFYGSRHYVRKSRRYGPMTRTAFYLSCIGLYRPVYCIMDFVRRSRNQR